MNKLSEPTTSEQRKEDRLSIRILVEITGIDPAGHLFNEYTFVEDVSDGGCRFETRAQFQCGDIVAVKPLEPGKKVLTHERSQLFEVAWTAHHRTSCTIGARKLHGDKLARAKFPPPDCSPSSPSKIK